MMKSINLNHSITIGKINQLSDNVKKLAIEKQHKAHNPSDWGYKIIIKRADNGFIIENPSDVPDDFITIYEVIECDGDEQDTMKYLLEKVAEFFGIMYNKFKNDNLNISWDKEGHKYEPPQE